MDTNKNDIISPLQQQQRRALFYVGPEHMSSSSRRRWTPQHERKREMEKEKSDAALAKTFDDPSFPFFLIDTSGSCASAA